MVEPQHLQSAGARHVLRGHPREGGPAHVGGVEQVDGAALVVAEDHLDVVVAVDQQRAARAKICECSEAKLAGSLSDEACTSGFMAEDHLNVVTAVIQQRAARVNFSRRLQGLATHDPFQTTPGKTENEGRKKH